jgi:hypothetical protein
VTTPATTTSAAELLASRFPSDPAAALFEPARALRGARLLQAYESRFRDALSEVHP